MATYNLPKVAIDKLVGIIRNLPKMSSRIRDQVIAALGKE
jgi:hypothetical protein